MTRTAILSAALCCAVTFGALCLPARAMEACTPPDASAQTVTPLVDGDAALVAVAVIREALDFSAKEPPHDSIHAFLPHAWTAWMNMLSSTDVTAYVMRHGAHASPETGEAVVTSSLACEGYHRWTVHVPVTVDYEAFGMQETQNLRLTLTLRQDADMLGGAVVEDASGE
jgi:hypothetical protein